MNIDHSTEALKSATFWNALAVLRKSSGFSSRKSLPQEVKAKTINANKYFFFFFMLYCLIGEAINTDRIGSQHRSSACYQSSGIAIVIYWFRPQPSHLVHVNRFFPFTKTLKFWCSTFSATFWQDHRDNDTSCNLTKLLFWYWPCDYGWTPFMTLGFYH